MIALAIIAPVFIGLGFWIGWGQEGDPRSWIAGFLIGGGGALAGVVVAEWGPQLMSQLL